MIIGSVYGLLIQEALWKLTLWHNFTQELSCRAVISMNAYLASLLLFLRPTTWTEYGKNETAYFYGNGSGK